MMNLQQQFMPGRFEAGVCEQRAKCPLGEICATARVLSKIAPEEITFALARHAKGDWGETDGSGQADNEQRLHTGGPLASIFRSERGIEFYILTESDRSATTI